MASEDPLPRTHPGDPGTIAIRAARPEDAGELARLAAELGYPTDADTMCRRLHSLRRRDDHAVLVAEQCAMRNRTVAAPGSVVFGWIHATRGISLEAGEAVEILGLVIDRRARRAGLGRRLVAAAEAWSGASGLDRVVVRSNVVRAESHQFYPALGFTLAKTQRVYVKRLGARPPEF